MRFFFQLFSDEHQLLVEGMDGFLILVMFLVFNVLTLSIPMDHPLLGDTLVLERLHMHQCL